MQGLAKEAANNTRREVNVVDDLNMKRGNQEWSNVVRSHAVICLHVDLVFKSRV